MQEKQETWVRSLGREDSLEEGTPTHFSILAWRIPWTEEPGRLQSIGSQVKRLSTQAPKRQEEQHPRRRAQANTGKEWEH